MVRASTTYISASVNRYSNAASVSGSSLVAFASHHFVALWDAKNSSEKGVFQTLPGHNSPVTCVKFHIGGKLIISADEQGFLRFWKQEKENSRWSSAGTQRAHEKSISAVAAYDDIVLTGSSDGTVKAWKLEGMDGQSEKLRNIQTLDFKKRYPLNIQVTRLPQSTALVLAIAGTDRSIGIWTCSDSTFVRSASLSGHEDWIKALAFEEDVTNPGVLTLASGSHDGTIRLWNIEKHIKNVKAANDVTDSLTDELLDEFESSLGDIAVGEEGGRQISMKRHMLNLHAKDGKLEQFSITFDALLIGHEAGVTSLSWHPNATQGSKPVLLSSSTDSSVILWSPSAIGASSSANSLWINQHRFGDIGGQRLGGFIASHWTGDGDGIMALGWRGGWRQWYRSAGNDESWTEVSALTGHHGPTKGLSWSPGGEYMITTSSDQTTRIHAKVNLSAVHGEIWQEIARPQVHGYDLVNAQFLDATHLVSIADEKVVRVFEATKNFSMVAKRLGISFAGDNTKLPVAAAVPPLALSNKAIDAEETEVPSTSFSAHRRPYEGELASATLWPETEKIFGHGYELISLAVSNNGKYIATACKATVPEHAVIRVYDTQNWQLFGEPLSGHALTVTRIVFSPDDKLILSVSRDRTWRLFSTTEDGYIPVAADKAHARIIWDCSWSSDGSLFVTAGRDKAVKIWQQVSTSPQKWKAIATIKTDEAATAVSFKPHTADNRWVAIGEETGKMSLYSSGGSLDHWELVYTFDKSMTHIDHIYSLQWRPRNTDSSSIQDQLASCSEDGTVRLFTVDLNET